MEVGKNPPNLNLGVFDVKYADGGYALGDDRSAERYDRSDCE